MREVIPYLSVYCHVLKGSTNNRERLTEELVPLALTDAGAVYGLLLSACRHVALRLEQNQRFLTLGIAYKLACLRALNEAISTDGAAPTDLTVVKALLLAYDEVSLWTARSSTASSLTWLFLLPRR